MIRSFVRLLAVAVGLVAFWTPGARSADEPEKCVADWNRFTLISLAIGKLSRRVFVCDQRLRVTRRSFDRLIGLVALVAITVTLVTLRFDLLWRTPVTVESGFTPHQLLIALGLLLGVSISSLAGWTLMSTAFGGVSMVATRIGWRPRGSNGR